MIGDNRPIGIFDSGVGGLTVVKEIMEVLPNESIIYFGDTKRVPYGLKEKEDIIAFSTQIVEFLIKQDVKLIIIACNTISACALDILLENFDIPFIEVISSAVLECLLKDNKNIGVIGTEATIKSNIYENKIKNFDKNINVYSKKCTLFVPLVEEGLIDNEVANAISYVYLKELLDKNIDSLILGCTHYPLLYNSIKKIMGDISIIDPAKSTALKAKKYIEKNKIHNNINNKNNKFYVSGDSKKFDTLCYKFINYRCFSEKINLNLK